MRSDNRKIIYSKVLSIIVILLPFLSVTAMLAFHGKVVSDCKPFWGDEQWYWAQAGGVAEYGAPLGYWGYNGGTPAIGTFAAWGPAIVLPYGIFAKIAGWNVYSYVYANIFYLCLSTLIFILLTRIEYEGLICLGLVNLCMIFRSYFAITAMAECIRYSLGIIGAALIIYIYKHNAIFVKYVFTPFFLLYITQAYLIFGLFFLFYFMIIFKPAGLKIFLRSVVSVISASIMVLFSRWFLGNFTSPYLTGKSSLITEKIFDNLIAIFALFFNKNKFFCVFFAGYFVLMICCFYFTLLKKRLNIRDRIIYFMVFIILASFLGGHIVFYSTNTWTFVRGLSAGLTISVYLLCLTKKRCAIWVFLAWSIISIPVYCGTKSTFINDNRFRSKEWDAQLADYTEIFKEVLPVNKNTDNPWENTVSTYYMTGSDIFTPALPKGYAVNTMMNGEINPHAKYAMIGKWNDAGKYIEKLEELLDSEYRVVFDDDRITVLLNERF